MSNRCCRTATWAKLIIWQVTLYVKKKIDETSLHFIALFKHSSHVLSEIHLRQPITNYVMSCRKKPSVSPCFHFLDPDPFHSIIMRWLWRHIIWKQTQVYPPWTERLLVLETMCLQWETRGYKRILICKKVKDNTMKIYENDLEVTWGNAILFFDIIRQAALDDESTT